MSLINLEVKCHMAMTVYCHLLVNIVHPPSFRVKQKRKLANITIVILVINLIRTNLTDIPLHHVTH